jgi:uncharacterized protein
LETKHLNLDAVNMTWLLAYDYSGLIQFIIPKALEYKVSRDINDDPILACALSAKADFIVSGDKDLLVLKEFEGIQIVTAAQALERLLKTP